MTNVFPSTDREEEDRDDEDLDDRDEEERDLDDEDPEPDDLEEAGYFLSFISVKHQLALRSKSIWQPQKYFLK